MFVMDGPQDPTGPIPGRPVPARRSRRVAVRDGRGRRRYTLMVVLLATGIIMFLILALLRGPDSESGDWQTHRATPADAFLDTVGVAMHHHYFDTAYGEHDLLAMLDRLGVRHIRDALTPQSMEFYAAFVEQAGPGAGVSYVVNDGAEMPLEEQIRMLAGQAPGTASQIESDNEPDCDDWSNKEAQHYRVQARELRSLMDSYAVLRDVPLTTPSLCRTTRAAYTTYGDDGVSERFNMHPYAAGLLPEAEIDEALRYARAADPNAVPVVTEGGYHNAIETDGDHKPTSMLAESAYLPQMFLEYNRRGIALTHTYELLDIRPDPDRDDDQKNFGLFHADGSIKPSGASMAALLDTLRDEDGERPQATDVELSISGGGDQMRVHPFVRSDGSIDVALWLAREIWDEDRRIDLPNPDAPVTVRVPSATEGSYVRINGAEEPERVQLACGTSFTVPVSAHPTILRIGPWPSGDWPGSVGPSRRAGEAKSSPC
ncbi:hypothetical protein [Pseudonocardia nigra]|uniref:hypothetical protein n=1 Tax=Pseudonocardia nigra TaxID=1921578 RepID=UPI001C5E71FE|nr:hypothetical protein [Pseudonocardia nigra]